MLPCGVVYFLPLILSSTGQLPREVGDLTALTVFGVYKNDLTGTIPVELEKLTKLFVLFLFFFHRHYVCVLA